MKEKFFSLYGQATDKNGQEHYVTVVGRCSQEKDMITIPTETVVEDDNGKKHNALLLVENKRKYKRFELARAITDPRDTFDFDKGVEICKKRIEEGEIIGAMETDDITMLNPDACQMLVFNEVLHITKNIDKYIS